ELDAPPAERAEPRAGRAARARETAAHEIDLEAPRAGRRGLEDDRAAQGAREPEAGRPRRRDRARDAEVEIGRRHRHPDGAASRLVALELDPAAFAPARGEARPEPELGLAEERAAPQLAVDPAPGHGTEVERPVADLEAIRRELAGEQAPGGRLED